MWFGLLGILLCSMLGGMRAVTWTQVAQYIVLIIAYLVPVIWMSNKQGFGRSSRTSPTVMRWQRIAQELEGPWSSRGRQGRRKTCRGSEY